MKRSLLFIILAVSVAGSISAQNNWYERYRECINDSSLEYSRQVIEQWEQAEPESPDVYAAWFNYYYKMGWEEVMQMTPIPPEDGIQALEFEDSTGAPVYMYQVEVFNASLLAIANEKIDRAISLYPDRLDLPFGKLAALFRLEDYDNVMPVLHQVIERSHLNGNRWTWTLNTPVGEDGEAMFKSSMQDYFSWLFNAELDDKAMQLVEWLLQYYPDEVMFRSDKASLLSITGHDDQALPLFLSIHKDYPDDNIVISNIAYIYEAMGDKDNALKYYRLLSDCGDEEMEELARQAISELTTND